MHAIRQSPGKALVHAAQYRGITTSFLFFRQRRGRRQGLSARARPTLRKAIRNAPSRVTKWLVALAESRFFLSKHRVFVHKTYIEKS